MAEELVTGSFEPTEEIGREERYRDNQRKAWEKRELTEEEYYSEVIANLEAVIGGPLYDYQRFWILASISGRRVEWTQARRGSHYHIVGLPCSICGRG